MPMESFDQYVILVKTTVICTGGSSFKPLGYPPLAPPTSDGDAMAYRVGAEVVGKAFCVGDSASSQRFAAEKGRKSFL